MLYRIWNHNIYRAMRILIYSIAFWGFLLLPTSSIENQATFCVFRNLFGIRCLGCGMTRGVSSLFHLDFVHAFQYNPLVFFLFPALYAFCALDGAYIISNFIYQHWIKHRKQMTS